MEDELIRNQLLKKMGELQKEEEIISELGEIQEPAITEGTVILTLLCC